MNTAWERAQIARMERELSRSESRWNWLIAPALAAAVTLAAVFLIAIIFVVTWAWFELARSI